MKLQADLVPATLLRRYKRFLADVELADGSVITAHVANPGAMIGLQAPGARVWLSKSPSKTRKLPYSWELIEADFGNGPELVGVNTMHPNAIVAEALADTAIPELAGYDIIRREVKYGAASRVDFLLEHPSRPPCYVEVKNVHMMRQPGLAEFPDSVTARGARHLDELAAMVATGARAVMLFVVQIGSSTAFALARDIDPTYGRAFDKARAAGVEAIAYTCRIDHDGIVLAGRVPIQA
ncbi:sugar fermentation stimulation protein A [Tardiphaga sp. OK246]|jgi:sugar fermentation stimulation protein A|uniref:DNA/RNA nuclease SfsA n=1 Tax=Tardiphaga sp. OK246 TaxID=1855307 RepID=UPI000B68A10A|nr:DNA/RNA nuclease SfsA [Tardiphaga sp. OK246]SNS45376.1 sugar fermentation stimulation protein A [Tardiphaga sp. OK246]